MSKRKKMKKRITQVKSIRHKNYNKKFPNHQENKLILIKKIKILHYLKKK